MPFILVLLLFLLLFPYLFIPFLVFLVIGFLFLIPYMLIFNSFFNIITIPWQILKIAADKRVRKNHGLEHATINVLERRYGRTLRIGGLAYANGFSLSGPDLPPPYEVLDAASKGLSLMAGGKTELALHPRCGTSIAAANFLFSLVFIVVLFYSEHLSLINIIGVFLLANILAKPFGLTLQRFFTTSPNVRGIVILDIYGGPLTTGFPFETMLNPNRTYYIKTAVAGSSKLKQHLQRRF